jgi:hypothetical protein
VNSRVVMIHPQAPAKPASGQACNGCGVCCLSEPCPVGILGSRRASGACRWVRWDGARYRCGLLQGRAGWREPLLRRWIGAGRGCDSTAEVRPAY